MLTSIFGRPFHFCTVGKSGVQLCFQLAQIFLLSGWRGRVTFSYRLAKISRLEASENLSHCSWLTDEVYKAFPRFQATRITTNLFMGYKRNQDKAKSLWAADQVNPNLPYQRENIWGLDLLTSWRVFVKAEMHFTYSCSAKNTTASWYDSSVAHVTYDPLVQHIL
jgi:hypothetical protein